MGTAQFDRLANALFGQHLAAEGFTSERSRHCTFYREVSDGFFHVILPDRGTRGDWYDVKVFAHCTLLDPMFSDLFPDELGIPTDSFSFLAPSGVGLDQTMFSCRHEEVFRRLFTRRVAPLLDSVAIPYLNQFHSLSDLFPSIRNPLGKAIATHYILGLDASRPLLIEQRRRLASLDQTNERVDAFVRLIDELLRDEQG